MIKEAQAAYLHWKILTVEARAEYLKRYATCLEGKRAYLAQAISEEMGKPLWESHQEVQAMINKVDISIKAYNERCKESDTLRFHPHGVVAVFGPFNFPGHLPNGHIVPALLAGNSVIFKPSEKTPKVGAIMKELFDEAGLPKDVLTVVQGGKEVAEEILSHKEVRGLYFTGSVAVGKELQRKSLDFPGRILALELGGNNPLIVSKVEDRSACIYTIIMSAFITSGQRCSCARRLIVTDDTILTPLVEAAKKLKIGRYTDVPEPFMGPLVSVEAKKLLLSQYNDLLSRGGKPLLAYKEMEGAFVPPLIVDMTGCPMVDVECFGPLLQVRRVNTLHEAIEDANNTEFGLVAGLLSDSSDEYKTFYDGVRAGVVNWNTPTTGASSLAPFGGIGLSGNYRPSGYFACDYTSYPVAQQTAIHPKLPDKIAPGVHLW